MGRIFDFLVREFLYCGLDKDSYKKNESYFKENNRNTLLGMTLLTFLIFFILTIGAVVPQKFEIFTDASRFERIYKLALVVCFGIIVILFFDKKGKTTPHFTSFSRIFMYTYGLMMSLVYNANEPTICLFVFVCMAPVLFYSRPLVFSLEIFAVNGVYFFFCDQIKIGERFQIDKVWMIIYSVAGIIIGTLNMRIRARSAENARLREQMLEEVRIARKEADDANKAKGQFLANMSHEIRTPINAVLGMDRMILRKSNDKDIRKYAENILSAGRSLLALINDILDFSKIESGKMDLVPVEYDVKVLVRDVYNIIIPRVNEKNLELMLDIDSSLPSRLYGDDVRIKQVVINLLTNAVKYTQTGSVILKIERANIEKVGIEEVNLEAEQQGDENLILRFSVIDTGNGIKQEDIKKLTEAFVRLEEDKNRNVEGTGLGINIITNLLGMMGSKLEVNSEYQKGSDFHFDLVQKVIDDTPIGEISEIESIDMQNQFIQESNLILDDVRILVVDDNRMNREVLIGLLSDTECEIDEASSGQECLELALLRKYDLIFMDIMMPIMDGVETLHFLQNQEGGFNITTPVVALTASVINGVKEQLLDEGFSGFVSKPIDEEELISSILDNINAEKIKHSKVSSNTNNEIDFEKNYQIDGIDYKAALLRVKDSNRLLSLIISFIEGADDDISELNQLYDKLMEGDSTDEFTIKIHSMKSSLSTIGAFHLAGLAKFLEYAGRESNINEIDGLFPTFKKEWEKLSFELNKKYEHMISKEDAPNTYAKAPQLTKDELIFFLDVLSEAMRDGDIDRADAVIEELELHSMDEESQTFLIECKLYVKRIEVSSCEDIITKWKCSVGTVLL